MAQEWSGKTGGTHWMQRALVAIIRKVDNRIIYGIMHLWLIWYVLVRPTERRGAYRFHRLRGRNRFSGCLRRLSFVLPFRESDHRPVRSRQYG